MPAWISYYILNKNKMELIIHSPNPMASEVSEGR